MWVVRFQRSGHISGIVDSAGVPGAGTTFVADNNNAFAIRRGMNVGRLEDANRYIVFGQDAHGDVGRDH